MDVNSSVIDEIRSRIVIDVDELVQISEMNQSVEYQISTKMESQPDKYRLAKRILIFLLSAVAGMIFAATFIIRRRLWYVSSVQLILQFCLGMFVLPLPIMFYNRIDFLYSYKIMFLITSHSVIKYVAFLFIFLALLYIPLIECVVICGCIPILTSLFSRIVTKETFYTVQITTLALGLGGVLLMVKFPTIFTNKTVDYDIYYHWGLLTAVSAAASYAISNCFICFPQLIDIHYSAIVFYNGIIGVILSIIILPSLTNYSPPYCVTDHWLSMVQFFLGACVNIFDIISLQNHGTETYTLLYNIIAIVTAFVWVFIVQRVLISIYTFVGGILVSISIALIFEKDRVAVFSECTKKTS